MSLTILVTGGTGYIGSHTCIELVNAGYKIVVIDNLSNSKMTVVKRLKEITKKGFIVYPIDLLNREALEMIFIEQKIDGVIHFAGLKSVSESVQSPLHYYKNNLQGTLHLLEMMKKYHVKKIVFSSSATVYGIPESVPISEEAPLQPINPYGRTKWMIEEILRDLYDADNEWSIALLRYFNPIGAHESGLIGEDPNGVPNNIMPYITQVAIGKRKELLIFGNDYPTIDGTGVRDYIHVMDLANGHVKALEKVINNKGIDVYNLGTGKGYSVFQLISAFQKTSGMKIPYIISARRQGDVVSSYANVSKAEKELGWVAKKGIHEMCRDSWRWQKHNPNGYENQKLP